jgi:hypothetical protein
MAEGNHGVSMEFMACAQICVIAMINTCGRHTPPAIEINNTFSSISLCDEVSKRWHLELFFEVNAVCPKTRYQCLVMSCVTWLLAKVSLHLGSRCLITILISLHLASIGSNGACMQVVGMGCELGKRRPKRGNRTGRI